MLYEVITDFRPLLGSRRNRLLPALAKQDVADQPGVAVSAAADHQGVAPRLLLHGEGVVGAEDVAAADDRHRQIRLEPADVLPVGVV